MTDVQSLSQPNNVICADAINEIISATQGNSRCDICRRTFKTARGLKQHSRARKVKTVYTRHHIK